MDNMTSLRTFRADGEVITTDPNERSDYDETTWAFHATTGLEMSKNYADNTSVLKTYDAYNRLATETDARGNVKTHSYEQLRGLHIGTTYSDETTPRQFSYSHLGQTTRVVDDSGTRTFSYNTYGERVNDSLSMDGDTHLITETSDNLGRSTGFVYSKNGAAQHTVTTGYGTDGRINSAGFLHGGAEKVFVYEYLSGTNLLHKLTKPNGMTLTQSYEEHRDLLIAMAYHRGTTLVAQREYVYDNLGRPTARNTARKGTVVNDTFAHNTRSELTAAQVNGEDYQYNYDNIGNRTTATEGGESTTYTANALNQYTTIQENEEAAFTPLFDADGNQTRIKTETGIWEVIYNAENRPVSFTNAESNTVVECAYDSMGRRAYKKVMVDGAVTLHLRYIYRGYLQIAALDLTRSIHPALWFITWDPTQPIATRPLSIRINGTWYTYGLDLTKNVCEVFGSAGYIATTYTYSPYGSVATTGSVTQPIQWSSEMWDRELGEVYYNWRYYNIKDGKWTSYDIKRNHNLYAFCSNASSINYDILGLSIDNSDENSQYLSVPEVSFDDLNSLNETQKEWGGIMLDHNTGYYPIGRVGDRNRGNCFRYAFNDIAKDGEPAFIHVIEIPSDATTEKLCNITTKKVLNMVGIRKKSGCCLKNEYEVALVTTTSLPGWQSIDIHWYRKDEDGTWSHKRGNTIVQMGIKNPLDDIQYGAYEECCRFCVNKPGIDLDTYY